MTALRHSQPKTRLRTQVQGATGPSAPTSSRNGREAIRGSIIGNYVDQFDIFVPVIALAPITGQIFGTAQAAASVGLVFVATLLGRPLGSFIFGPMADRMGRTRITKIALLGVMLTTLCIALTPGHQTIGPWAFALVLLFRFLGGLFLGGQYTAAIPLAMEWSAPRRRGLISGTIMAMSPCANASIAALTFVLYATLGETGYAAWGWRVIFLIGALLAGWMLWHYSHRVADPPASRSSSPRENVLKHLFFGDSARRFASVFVLMSGLWIGTNMAVVVLTTALKTQAGLAPQAATTTLFWATAVSAPAMALLGHVSTFTGRRRFFMLFGMISTIAAPLLYLAVFSGQSLPSTILLACALQCVTVAGYGPVGAHLAEQFSENVRSSGYGIGYSLSIVLPALFPYYLPALQNLLGATGAVAALLALAGLLIAVGGALASPALLQGSTWGTPAALQQSAGGNQAHTAAPCNPSGGPWCTMSIHDSAPSHDPGTRS